MNALPMKTPRRLLLALLMISLYVIIQFIYPEKIESISPYASYGFDLFFVVGTLFYYRKNFSKDQLKPARLFPLASWPWLQMILNLAFGFIVFRLAIRFHYEIPFDLKNLETILFLLIIGPVLEEFVFRQALWFPIEDLVSDGTRLKDYLVLILNALLFGYAHFQVYSSVPDVFRPFVLYQAVYTFVFGLWWASSYLQTRAIAVPITLHVLFNLGFFMGAFF